MKKARLINISLLSLILLSSCGQKDFAKENLIKPEDFFLSEYSKYGVYYFQEDCPMCAETLPFITEYLNKIERKRDKYDLKEIYFIDAEQTPLNRFDISDRNLFLDNQIGVTNYNDVLTIGYPLLYIVENIEGLNTIVDIKIGKAATTEYIKTIW